MEATERLATLLPRLSDFVDQLWHQQLELPVPGGATVHGTLDRLMVLGATYAQWLRRQEADALGPPSVYGWVPAAEFREVMADLLDAASRPGIDNEMIDTPTGRISGARLIDQIALGAALHGLDLAMATGRDFELPPSWRADVDAFFRAA